MSKGQGKFITKHNARYKRFLRAYLGWALKPLLKNHQISQYIFIEILCAKMFRVTWTQECHALLEWLKRTLLFGSSIWHSSISNLFFEIKNYKQSANIVNFKTLDMPK